MTKSNLQIAGSSFDDYLEFLIDAAQNATKAEGITIDFEAIDDCNLIVMYTSYLYRKRVGDDPVMPRMLRYALNNRVFAEKAKPAEGGDST
jgi:hypothetical protein